MSQIIGEFRNFPVPYAHLNCAPRSFQCSRLRLAAAAATTGVRHWWQRTPSLAGSFLDAVSRLTMVLSVTQRGPSGVELSPHAHRVDMTEKAVHSYILGMACATALYQDHARVPWMEHLDTLVDKGIAQLAAGGTRPDLVGMDLANQWHAVEAKGRRGLPSDNLATDGKNRQASNLSSVNGQPLATRSGFAAFVGQHPISCLCVDPPDDGVGTPVRIDTEGLVRQSLEYWHDIIVRSRRPQTREVVGRRFSTASLALKLEQPATLEVGIDAIILNNWGGAGFLPESLQVARELLSRNEQSNLDEGSTSVEEVVLPTGLLFRLT